MRRKDIILLIILGLLVITLVVVFLFLTQEKNTTNSTTLFNSEENNQNINEEINNINISNSNNNSENINDTNQNINKEVINFENFFKLVYLAKFTGQSEPPVSNEFIQTDNIVASAKLVENLKTDLKMNFKIYKDEKLISETGEIEILNGEVGLKNPSKKGDYIVELFVDNILIKSLPFKIN